MGGRDAPENVRLDLKRSIRGLGMLTLFCSREELIGNRRVNEGGALPAIIFCMYMPLLYFSLVCSGRIFSKL